MTCSSNATREIVIIGTSDLFRSRFTIFDRNQGRFVPFPFENATRVVITFAGLTVDESTFTQGSIIDTSEGDGIIVFRLGGTVGLVPVTLADAVIRVFDPAHINGQTIAHPNFINSSLQLTVSN